MILSTEGHIATIRLNRPEEHNRIEPADLDALIGHIAAVNENREIRALILASTGKTFSAGFHLGAIGTGAPEKFQAAADALADCRVPSIASIQGNVYGGAADLALCCDFRIAVESVELMVPAVKLGIPYYPSALERFSRRISLRAAKRILLLCETLKAPELAACGYLDEIVARESLEARVAELAAQLASMAPLAAQAIKAQLNRFDRASAEQAVRDCLVSADHKEGLAAWIEKRTAQFK